MNTARSLYLIEILHQTTTQVRAYFQAYRLYLIEILHQTTTISSPIVTRLPLYLIEILHQTTTELNEETLLNGCILLKFYIKPQQEPEEPRPGCVVSY